MRIEADELILSPVAKLEKVRMQSAAKRDFVKLQKLYEAKQITKGVEEAKLKLEKLAKAK